MSGTTIDTIVDDHIGANNETQESSTAGDAGQAPATETVTPVASPRTDGADTTAGSDQSSVSEKRPSDRDAQRNAKPGGRDAVRPNNGDVTPERFRALQNTHAAVSRQNVNLTTNLQRIETELKAYKDAAIMPQQLGLAPADVAAAMQFMAHWKKDPAGAAKFVLTEAQALGHTIDTAGGGIPMDAIARMLDERLKPFNADRERTVQQTQQQQAVDREIEEAVTEFPWLNVQDAAVTKVIQQHPQMPLREIALRMQVFAAQNGLDLEQPLEPQFTSKQRGGSQPSRQNAARVPAPGAAGDNPIEQPYAAAASANVSNRRIVEDAMRKAGLNPNA